MVRREPRANYAGINSLIPVCLCLSVFIWILIFVSALYLMLAKSIDLLQLFVALVGAAVPFFVSLVCYIFVGRGQGGVEPLRLFSPKAVPAVSSGRGGSCMVCARLIDADELILSCPHCGGQAHRSHLEEWLKSKGVCPMCRRKLRGV